MYKNSFENETAESVKIWTLTSKKWECFLGK
jgi:hypothetical protein